MKASLICIFGILAIFELQANVIPEHSVGSTLLAANIYKELRKSESENFLASPVSVQAAVALAHAGAKGITAEELAKGVDIPNDRLKIQETVLQLYKHLGVTDGYTLENAVKLFIADRFLINPDYKNTTSNVFDADIETVDYSRSEHSASEINKWVKEETNGKIENIVESDRFDSLTAATILNAVCFQANWSQQFEPALNLTSFYVNDQETVEVEMIHQTGSFQYYDNDELKAQFLEIPYQGDKAVMTLVLPRKLNGLSALEERIEDVFIKQNYVESKVKIQIPKFRVETIVDVKGVLQTLGVQAAFSPDAADFSDMSDNLHDLYLNDILQKTLIEIDENGSSASAASVAGTRHVRDTEIPKTIIANHPFIVFLKHKEAGILYVGRVMRPVAAAPKRLS